MSKVDITPVVGLPQQHGWAQVFYDPARSFVCVFAISGDGAGNVGRDLVDNLREKFPQTAEELHQFLTTAQEDVSSKNCQLQIAASLFESDQSWFGVYDGMVILKRGAKVGQILSPQQKVLVIKGKATVDDIFVLGTNQIQSILGELTQKLEQGYEADTIVTSIVPGVHGLDDSSQSALVFITIKSDQAVIEPRLTIEEMFDDRDLEPELESESELESYSDLGPASPPELVPQPESQPTKSSTDLKIKINFGQIKAKLQPMAVSAINLVRTTTSGVFSQDVYIRQPKRKKLVRLVIIGVILLLLIVGPLVWWRTTVNRQRTSAQEQVAPLLQQVDQAKLKVSDEPIVARQEVESVITELETLEQTHADQRYGLKVIQDALTQTQEYYQSISGKEEFSQLPTFFDLRTIEQGFITSSADLIGDTAYFLDTGKQQLIELNLSSKQQQLFDISQVGNPKNISASQDAVFIISDQGVFRFNRDSTAEDVRIIKTRDSEDQNSAATIIDTFGEFVYVFNPAQRNIYRYAPAEEGGGLADPTGWVRSAQNLEYDQINSMQIDGDIWLADKTGQVIKMASGQQAEFTPTGVTDGLSTPLMLFTKDDYENIYLLEADKNRILVLTKTGEFLKEITSGSLASGTSLFVDEPNGKAYVVSGAEVFETEI